MMVENISSESSLVRKKKIFSSIFVVSIRARNSLPGAVAIDGYPRAATAPHLFMKTKRDTEIESRIFVRF